MTSVKVNSLSDTGVSIGRASSRARRLSVGMGAAFDALCQTSVESVSAGSKAGFRATDPTQLHSTVESSRIGRSEHFYDPTQLNSTQLVGEFLLVFNISEHF